MFCIILTVLGLIVFVLAYAIGFIKGLLKKELKDG